MHLYFLCQLFLSFVKLFLFSHFEEGSQISTTDKSSVAPVEQIIQILFSSLVFIIVIPVGQWQFEVKKNIKQHKQINKGGLPGIFSTVHGKLTLSLSLSPPPSFSHLMPFIWFLSSFRRRGRD